MYYIFLQYNNVCIVHCALQLNPHSPYLKKERQNPPQNTHPAQNTARLETPNEDELTAEVLNKEMLEVQDRSASLTALLLQLILNRPRLERFWREKWSPPSPWRFLLAFAGKGVPFWGTRFAVFGVKKAPQLSSSQEDHFPSFQDLSTWNK